jgi:transposase-like protein
MRNGHARPRQVITMACQQEYRQFAECDLSGVNDVYLWVDGIQVKVRLDRHELCTLVIVGARADGKKELGCPAATTTRP